LLHVNACFAPALARIQRLTSPREETVQVEKRKMYKQCGVRQTPQIERKVARYERTEQSRAYVVMYIYQLYRGYVSPGQARTANKLH
jgi:hypothetical protein